MAGYEFKPIVEEDLPDVAAFLNQQQEITSRDDFTQPRPGEDDLRWLLRNPHLRPGLNHGETLRGPEGKILGMILAVPRMYLLGDQRLLGLAAGQLLRGCVRSPAGLLHAPAIPGNTRGGIRLREFLQSPIGAAVGKVRGRWCRSLMSSISFPSTWAPSLRNGRSARSGRRRFGAFFALSAHSLTCSLRPDAR